MSGCATVPKRWPADWTRCTTNSSRHEEDATPPPREVIFFTSSHAVGGAEHALLLVMSGLDRRHWRPVLAHSGHAGLRPVLDACVEASIDTLTVPEMPEGIRGAVNSVAFARAMRGRLPALFHAHLTRPLDCKWPLLTAAAARVPVVATLHLYFDQPLAWTTRAQLPVVRAAIDHTIVVSREGRTGLIERLGWRPERISVIHNGIDTSRFRATPPPQGDRTVLVPARLEPQKGHEYMIRAAESLPGVRFLVAGDGALRDRLRKQAAQSGVLDRVRFLGHRSDIPSLLARCEVVLLPSLFEGLPLAVLEAMAAGRPVVATDIPGTRDAVVDGVTGLLVPARDPHAMAHAIRRLLDDPSLAADLGRAGRTRVAAEFDATAMVAANEEVYRRLLDG